ncbi:PREDICTED: uncharacterized protein LOC106147566 [Chinchilla lanigera]|uniref:uncharacterized protein LOC106147566 n=1 Tax=Chinchilla lanigera TaxID=34839 RepID=UPI0006969635|nr:PREDICTED: uncharacterized protein LOC106147566 [Chinchilla lanigera]
MAGAVPLSYIPGPRETLYILGMLIICQVVSAPRCTHSCTHAVTLLVSHAQQRAWMATHSGPLRKPRSRFSLPVPVKLPRLPPLPGDFTPGCCHLTARVDFSRVGGRCWPRRAAEGSVPAWPPPAAPPSPETADLYLGLRNCKWGNRLSFQSVPCRRWCACAYECEYMCACVCVHRAGSAALTRPERPRGRFSGAEVRDCVTWRIKNPHTSEDHAQNQSL